MSAQHLRVACAARPQLPSSLPPTTALLSSTPAGRRSSHSSSTYTNASLLDAIIEPVGQVTGAPGAAKRKGLGPKTAERENCLRTEQSAADVSTSQETALITPHNNTMRDNNLKTSKNYVKNNVRKVSNNDISNADKNKKLEKASQSKRSHTSTFKINTSLKDKAKTLMLNGQQTSKVNEAANNSNITELSVSTTPRKSTRKSPSSLIF